MAEYESGGNEERVKLWQCRVELARRYQNKYGDTQDRWTKNIKALAGEFNSLEEIGEGAVDVHVMRSSAKTALPPLWVTEPRIMVRPTTSTYRGQDNIRRAENTEIEINYWLRELGVRDTARKCILDAYATNHGYAYIGYTKDKTDIEIDGEVFENVPTVRYRQPFVRRIPSRDVLVPPGYDCLEECPWVCLVFRVTDDYVKAKWGADLPDESYVNYEDSKSGTDTSQYSEYVESRDAKRAVIYNVWDKQSRRVYIFAKNHSEFLEEPAAWPYEVEGFPVADLQFEYIPDEYYGTPPMSYSLTQNKELNITRTAMSRRRRKTKSVIFVKGEVAREVRESYQKAEDGDIIPVDTDDLRSSIVVDPGIQFDQGDIIYDSVVKDDVRTADGLGAEQRGSGDPNVDSATASANIEKHAQVRASDRGDLVRGFYLTIARKLWMILKQFPDRDVTRMVLGPRRDQLREVSYSLRELRGEFAFEMDVSAMLSDNPMTRQTQAVLNYNLLRADPLVNPEQLVLDIFQTQNKANPEAYLVYLRAPEQELEMMLQALPVEAHDRDDHMAHLRQHEIDGDRLAQLQMRFAADGRFDTPEMGKVQLALALMQSHVNDHMAKLQKLNGGPAKPAGQPVAENMLRNQVRAGTGGETQAELTGQPLSQADTVQ